LNVRTWDRSGIGASGWAVKLDGKKKTAKNMGFVKKKNKTLGREGNWKRGGQANAVAYQDRRQGGVKNLWRSMK